MANAFARPFISSGKFLKVAGTHRVQWTTAHGVCLLLSFPGTWNYWVCCGIGGVVGFDGSFPFHRDGIAHQR
jgi:hypothetical protein